MVECLEEPKGHLPASVPLPTVDDSTKVDTRTAAQRRLDALEAARVSALRLANSVMQLAGPDHGALLFYDMESPTPTLDPAPTMFPTPTEEKNAEEKSQTELLSKTVAAKKAWERVSALKKEKLELERVLAALRTNPSIRVGTQFETKLGSMARLKQGLADVAVARAQLAEAELTQVKLEGHELKVTLLQAKIAAVERLKREQRRRAGALMVEPGAAGLPDVPSVGPTEKKGPESDKDTFLPAFLVERADGTKLPAARNLRFFSDCFQGLSTWYGKALLERGWHPYPSEKWFVTELTKLQIWSPLAKSSVDYCDTGSFSKGVHSLLWEGGDWLEDKAKLSELCRATDLMPAALVVPKGGEWDGSVDPARVMGATKNWRPTCGSTCGPGLEGGKCWPETSKAAAGGYASAEAAAAAWAAHAQRKEGGVSKWFVKDATRNYSTGVFVCKDLAEAQEVCAAKGAQEAWVVQEAVEPQMLTPEGYRFGCRVYLAVVSPPKSGKVHLYTYTDGWITTSPKPWVVEEGAEEGAEAAAFDPARQMSRERSISLTKWEGYGEYFPKFRSMLKEALRLVLSKLTVKEDVPCFELFGVDFLLAADGRPWLVEVNRSPRQKDEDVPMLHQLLDLVLGEAKTGPRGEDDFTPKHRWETARGEWEVLDLGVPTEVSVYVPPPPPIPAVAAPALAAPSGQVKEEAQGEGKEGTKEEAKGKGNGKGNGEGMGEAEEEAKEAPAAPGPTSSVPSSGIASPGTATVQDGTAPLGSQPCSPVPGVSKPGAPAESKGSPAVTSPPPMRQVPPVTSPGLNNARPESGQVYL